MALLEDDRAWGKTSSIAGVPGEFGLEAIRACPMLKLCKLCRVRGVVKVPFLKEKAEVRWAFSYG